MIDIARAVHHWHAKNNLIVPSSLSLLYPGRHDLAAADYYMKLEYSTGVMDPLSFLGNPTKIMGVMFDLRYK